METVYFNGIACHTYGSVPSVCEKAPEFSLVDSGFNVAAGEKKGAAVLCVSMDLPFAMQRFCTANDINNVIATSAFRSPEFVKGYGVEIIDGPLKGLLARAVIILDENRNVIYRELVEEITKEPDYEAALKML